MARFVIGIDLGTSNTAACYADLEEVREKSRPIIHELPVPQLVGPGDLQTRTLLPSSMFELSKFDWLDGQDELPWSEDIAGQKRIVVGEGAQRLGAKTPVRLVESAKSWLCHGGVNRTAQILPWHAPDEIPKISPVEASANYLAHIKAAWDHEMAGDDPALAFEAQSVVITVPASFDEVARRLTLDAAKRAKLPNVTLIEEPLAAFYAFIARTGGTRETTGLTPGERVLVADVGGGTTDFTLIEVGAPLEEGGLLNFERTAVGDHLLLGGDNIDLALAHAMEPSLTQGKKKLDAEGWAQLKLECRLAKEALFNDPSRDSVPVVVAGRGSKLIGGSMKGALTREMLRQVVFEGYFPDIPAGDAAKPRPSPRTGFAEYGLPYATEPAITRHLAAFLLRHHAGEDTVSRVDALLFNGGALKPVELRDRVSKQLGQWLRESGPSAADDPRPLVYDQGDEALELAVARGAAYFGLVRSGHGLRVGGGSPREYFIGLAADESDAIADDHVRVLCVAPKGMQDGQQLEVSNREFELVTNRPVQFPMFSSTGPEKHPLGEVLELPTDSLHPLPALQTVVKFGKQKAGTTVPVRIQAKRSEIGTLELSCFSRMSGARFKLEFDLRNAEPSPPTAAGSKPERKRASVPVEGAGAQAPVDAGDVEPEKLDRAKAEISETFKVDTPRPDPDGLMKRLEAELGLKRGAFPLPTIRALAEHLLELTERRALSPALEERWMNVTGFCLRPGSGFPLDDWRVRQLWKIHTDGVIHGGRDPCELNWWILWRRVAPGLGRGHQEELSSIVLPLLVPNSKKRPKRKPPRAKSQEAVEMWRCAASLERIGAKSRAAMGGALVDAIEAKKAPKSALWCLGRFGARRLLYGPREATVKATTVKNWLDRLLAMKKISKDEDPTSMLVSMGRKVGDRQFDLDDDIRQRLIAYLEERGASEETVRPLREIVEIDAMTERQAFGEGLPSGLRIG